MQPITEAEFDALRGMIHRRLGIHLTQAKRTLLVGRLQKVLRKYRLPDFRAYLDFLTTDSSGEALSELANRISTNHTYFYREHGHFEYLARNVFPYWIERLDEPGARDLRLWCAGCATGEEAYGLAITIQEYLGPRYGSWQAGVLATDVSEDALAYAREGVYEAENIQHAPERWRSRYFQKKKDGHFAVAQALKREVTFRRLNLMSPAFPFKRRFHVIFCRNVMIYFDQETREQLVRRFFELTEPGGFLFIGHAEALPRATCPYRYLQPAVYQRPA